MELHHTSRSGALAQSTDDPQCPVNRITEDKLEMFESRVRDPVQVLNSEAVIDSCAYWTGFKVGVDPVRVEQTFRPALKAARAAGFL